jgi:hypothetical protein
MEKIPFPAIRSLFKDVLRLAMNCEVVDEADTRSLGEMEIAWMRFG